ncbi:MAG: helix-turn-helix transcriptional regulator [Deltaproteobacteria bacterium]|nr:helix-turn-helix transcriptional regulator [Nannocystaceae bacterium]
MSSLAVEDVRALVRLLGELRELGRDSEAWRRHLVDSLGRICHARVAVVSELKVNARVHGDDAAPSCASAVTPLQLFDHGVDDERRTAFYAQLYWYSHGADDPLRRLVPLYGSQFTVLRHELVDDREWYGSTLANEAFRRWDCDDFLFSMVPVRTAGVICSLELFRGWRDCHFADRERLLISLLHEELARDWSRAGRQTTRLTPRQREVLRQLVAGASEKELAFELGVSTHTAHDHVKALYRAFGVRSRGELLGRVAAANDSPRTRLVAEGG